MCHYFGGGSTHLWEVERKASLTWECSRRPSQRPQPLPSMPPSVCDSWSSAKLWLCPGQVDRLPETTNFTIIYHNSAISLKPQSLQQILSFPPSPWNHKLHNDILSTLLLSADGNSKNLVCTIIQFQCHKVKSISLINAIWLFSGYLVGVITSVVVHVCSSSLQRPPQWGTADWN